MNKPFNSTTENPAKPPGDTLPARTTTAGERAQREETPTGHEMTLFEHLGELRRRIIISFISVVVAAIASFFFSEPVFKILNAPYFAAFHGHPLIGTGPAEAIFLKIQVSFFVGILLASPILFYQIWLFVAPGLHAHEKRFVVPFVSATTSLFVIGVLFCYYFIFPVAFTFFAQQYDSVGLTATIRVTEHIDLSLRLLLAFGLVFEMPALAFLLGRLGVIDEHTLVRSWRWCVLAIFIVAAILTPPDVLSMFLMAGPLLLLFGLSILLVKFTATRNRS